MGIGFVLFLWAFVGTILAIVSALVFSGTTALITLGAQNGRKRVILAAGLLPFVCLAWAGTVFVFQAVVNESLLHRDAGLGDSWRCPLPNGYALLMIDLTDHGWVYNPKTQRHDDSVSEGEDAISGVRTLQVAGHFILGSSDSNWSEHLEGNESLIDSFFIIDTTTGKRTTLSDKQALSVAAKQLGIQLDLAPINVVYSKYRFTTFDVFAVFLLLLPPIGTAFFLVKWVARVRRTKRLVTQTA